MYTLIKLPIDDLIENDFKMNVSRYEEYEREYVIRQVDSLLFNQIEQVRGHQTRRLDELILIVAKKNPRTHNALLHILAEGFDYNGRHYVRFGKSASQGKEGITVFIDENIYDEMMERTQLGIKPKECVISKYEAQRCLVFSNCTILKKTAGNRMPNIVIVDEYEKYIKNQEIFYVNEVEKEYVKNNKQNDRNNSHHNKNENKNENEKIIKYKDHEICQGIKDIKISPFDGCGVHDFRLGEMLQRELGLSYRPAGMQVRMPFIKGFSVEFPFREYLKNLGVDEITDVYGYKHKIENVDAIWNTSMFKAHKLFLEEYGNEAWIKYIKTYKKYGYALGVSKYSHCMKHLDLKTRLNFQYVQCLDLWNEQYIKVFNDKTKDFYDILSPDNVANSKVVSLASYSTDLLERIIKAKQSHSIEALMMLGILELKDRDRIEKIHSQYLEACLINERMFEDLQIRRFIYNKMKRLIHEMKLGKIYVDGLYHTVVGDIFGYMEYVAFGNENVYGCLKEREFYAATRPHSKGETAVSMRSPLVCPSEVNKITLGSNSMTDYWLKSWQGQDICMLNMYDISLPQQGGMKQYSSSLKETLE